MDPQQKLSASVSPNPSSNLLFVHSTGPPRGRARDEATKRQIRQHVMRDIGKARRKPARNPQVNLRVRSPSNKALLSSSSSPSALPSVAAGLGEQAGSDSTQLVALPSFQYGSEIHLPSPTRPFWDQHPLSLMELEWGMDAFAAYGLAFAVAWEKSVRDPMASRFWFPFAFNASDFCHRFLTGPEVRAAISSQSWERSITFALARSTELMVCIESKLRNPDIKAATGINVLQAIMGCICYNYIVSDFETARVHLEGLRLLLAARGGMESLKDSEETIMMIFWIDTIASLLFDQKPQFPLPSCLLPALPQEELPEILTTLELNLHGLCPNPDAHQLDIVSALKDIWSLSEVIQYKLITWGEELWKEEIYLGTRLNPIAYRLLDASPHPHLDMPCSIIGALRLGALLWILGIKQKAQAYPGSSASYVTRLLHLLQSQSIKNLVSDSPYFIPYHLWLVFLCATMTGVDSERTTALRMLTHTMDTYGWTWEDVMANVGQLPWICGLEGDGPALATQVHLLRSTV